MQRFEYAGWSIPLFVGVVDMRHFTLRRQTVNSILLVLLGQFVAIFLARLALASPLPAVGLIYAIGFWVLAWKRPPLALMLIFASAPFQQDIGGGSVKFSFAEIHLALTLPVLLVRNWMDSRPIRLSPVMIPIALYLGIGIFSSSENWRGSVSLVSLVQIALYLIIAVVIFSSLIDNVEDFTLALKGLVVVGVFLAAGGAQLLGFQKNGLGASLACAFLVCVELWISATKPKHKTLYVVALMIITGGLIATLSRGSWAGSFLGLVFIICMRRQFSLLLKVVVVLVPLIAIAWNLMPQEDKEYALGFDRKRYNIQARYESVDIAKAEYEKNPLYGTGVGFRKQYDATNVQWLTLAETGVLGLGAFTLIHIAVLGMVWTTKRHFSYTHPCYSLLCISGALVLYKLMHGSVDHYWSRGAITPVWASVGMAIFVYYVAKSGRFSRNSDSSRVTPW
jgi:hypothetical protein